MASNNRKPQQRWSRDGNDGERFPSLGQRAARQRPGGAFRAKRGMDVRKVEEALDDMFLSVFDAEIIRAVAQACDWKLDSAVEKLLTLSIGHGLEDTGAKPSNPGGSLWPPDPTPKSKISKTPDISKQQLTEPDANSGTIMWPPEMSSSTSKRVLKSVGQSSVKVTYRGQADQDASDDDADVVIEEEKEFEVFGFDTPLGIPSSQPMCQFLSPLVTADQQTFSGMLPPGGLIASKPREWRELRTATVGCPNTDAVKSGAKKSKHWPKLEKIRKWIGEGIKVMILMRGCPGSGKTSLARHIIKLTYGENHQNYVFSTDQFFCSSGKYMFNPKQLPEAHEWNQRRVLAKAREGVTPIIIDNTNIEAWEMKPYAHTAVENGYILELLEPRTSWKNNAAECERKNTHNVSRRKIEDMLQRFDHSINPSSLLGMFNLKYYSNNKPPQYTKQPRLLQGVSQSSTAKKKSKKKDDPSKVKKKEIKNNSEPGRTQEIQDMFLLNQSTQVFRNTWQPLESTHSCSSNNTGGTFDVSASASPFVKEMMNWLQDNKESVNTQIPLPNPAETVKENITKDDGIMDDSRSTEDDGEAVSAACFLDDESGEEEEEDDDLNFDGFEESDSGNEIITVGKEIEQENVNTCTEYVLVLSDGITLPQYNHSEETSKLRKENYVPKRVWEYLVSEEELKKLTNTDLCEGEVVLPSQEKGVEKNPEREGSEIFPSTSLVERNLLDISREDNLLVMDTELENIGVKLEKESTCMSQKLSEHNKSDTAQNDFCKSLITFDCVEDSQKSFPKTEALSEEREIHLLDNVEVVPESKADGKNIDSVSHVDNTRAPETNFVENKKNDQANKMSVTLFIAQEESEVHEQIQKKDSKEFQELLETCESGKASDKISTEGDITSINPSKSGNEEIKEANLVDIVSDLECSDMNETLNSDPDDLVVKDEIVEEDVKDTANEKCADSEVISSVILSETANQEPVLHLESVEKNVLKVASDIVEVGRTDNQELEELKEENAATHPECGKEMFHRGLVLGDELKLGDIQVSESKCEKNQKGSICEMSEELSVQAKNEDALECITFAEKMSSLGSEQVANIEKGNSEINVENATKQIGGNCKKEHSETNVEQIETIGNEEKSENVKEQIEDAENLLTVLQNAGGNAGKNGEQIESKEEHSETNVEHTVEQIKKISMEENSENAIREIKNTENSVNVLQNAGEKASESAGKQDCGKEGNSETNVEYALEQTEKIAKEGNLENAVEEIKNAENFAVDLGHNGKRAEENGEQTENANKEVSQMDAENVGKALSDEIGCVTLQRKTELGDGDIPEPYYVDADTTCRNLNQESFVEGVSIRDDLSFSSHFDKSGEGDLLLKWESGDHWDEKGKGEAEEQESKSGGSTPKPARVNRRRGSVKSRSARSLSPIRSEKTKTEAPVEDVWTLAVEDPLQSWEKTSDEASVGTPQSVKANEPQPQRSVFALLKQGDKNMEGEKEEEGKAAGNVDSSALPGYVKDSNQDSSLSWEETAVAYPQTDIEEGAQGGSYTNNTETNTHHSDFILLSNINIGSEAAVQGIKVMPAFSRNITNQEISIPESPEQRKTGVHTLDKSSMTVDATSASVENGNIEDHVQELHRMFPSCPIDALRELFEKCNKDVNWTVDLLLESVNQGIDLCSISDLKMSHLQGYVPVGGDREGTDESMEIPESSSSNGNSLPIAPDSRVKSVPSARRTSKKDRNAPLSEISILLKKQLEENIVINDEHYSEHVSRIRKIKHGELPDMGETEVGTSQNTLELGSSPNDVDVWQHTLRPDAPEWNAGLSAAAEASYEEDVEEDEEEENVQLKLDNTFTEQLHKLFGTASLPFKQDSVPTLNLPMTLARQLHYYLMEAEQNTYDLMMQEDEELARQLQQQENARDSDVESKPADLREIMEMEMALAMYKADQKQFRDESKDDMATRLKKNLLCEWFPSLPRDVLVNVFEAHNHSFDQTIEVLVASTEEDNTVRTVMSPEARAAYEKALIERARQESEKTAEPPQTYEAAAYSEVTQEKAFQDADFYRSEATRFYSLRNECQTKAQRAYQRGHPSVAAYYSQMAALHKQKIEENNAKAASSLLLAHSLGNLTTTLDLHFLYVVEALQVLDMFLDHHVHKLAGSGQWSKQVFVITGRGARSSGGRSRIKPAVVQRLEHRGLRHTEVNPGLLGITICRNSALSTSVDC